jgi:surfeit locus 1 family protein
MERQPMSRLQTIGFGIMILIVATSCILLGRWQLHRLAERRAANRSIGDIRSLPEVSLNENYSARLDHRRLRASGRFDHARTIVLRGQPLRGTPGVRVVTPLIMPERDSAVLVIRGFVPSADAVTVDRSALAAPDSAFVAGPAIPIRRAPGAAQPVGGNGATTWRRLEQTAVEEWAPYPVMSVAILVSPAPEATGFPRAIAAPPLDDGPHLSYAIQWFAFAAIALIGGVSLIYHRGYREKK